MAQGALNDITTAAEVDLLRVENISGALFTISIISFKQQTLRNKWTFPGRDRQSRPALEPGKRIPKLFAMQQQ